MSPETRGGARAFVRSLNILLKFARLYEFGHAKTTQQFETAWKELRGALDDSGGSGVLLGASGTQILLDGVPLGSSAGERSFAQLLTSSGIASIHSGPTLTQPQFARFVPAFPRGNARTDRANCGCVSVGPKGMLAIPDEVKSCAKLLSPADE